MQFDERDALASLPASRAIRETSDQLTTHYLTHFSQLLTSLTSGNLYGFVKNKLT
jgi:hypothetical protein